MQVYIVNGPNLNLLGIREPEMYGQTSFSSFLKILRSQSKDVEIHHIQSNAEHELIQAIHDAGKQNADGIIINPGAFTHSSLAIADAIRAVNIPTIEVHVSHVFAREQARHVSKISSSCVGSISGLGLSGYRLALNFLTQNQ
jgi:3-dehydroquinate dehydratase-2